METNYRMRQPLHCQMDILVPEVLLNEGYDFSVDEGLEGNFINGFYESVDIPYGEWNYGFPTKSQSLLNLPDLKKTEIYADGELFDMRTGKVEDYSRVLHMKDGYVERKLTWISPKGKKLQLVMERFVSLVHKNRMYQRIQITPVNFSGEIRICSHLNGDVENHTRKTNPLIGYGPFGSRLHMDKLQAEDGVLYYEGTTLQSCMTVGCGSQYKIEGAGEIVTVFETEEEKRHAVCESRMEIPENTTVTCEKAIVYTSSQDMEVSELERFTKKELKEASENGWRKEFQAHMDKIHEFWDVSDVQIYDDETLQQGIRFNLFHIMQSAGRDGRTGMGAKGFLGKDMKDTISGIQKCMCFRYLCTQHRSLQENFWSIVSVHWIRPGTVQKFLDTRRGLFIHGVLLMERKLPLIFHLVRPSIISMQILPMRFWLYVSVTGDMEFFQRYGC